MILMSGRTTPLRFTATPLLRVTTPARAVAPRLRRTTTPLPWPESATDKQRAAVEAKAQAVLAARAEFMNVGDDVRSLISKSKNQRLVTSSPTKSSTLADLYDPLSMPPELVKAHAELDRAVEKCYRPEPFHSDRERVEYLFSLYEKLTAPLLPATPKKRGRAVKPEPC
jgi:hypothetical protein